jgi:hypothetical protein
LQPHIGFAFANCARQFRRAGDPAFDLESAGIDEAIYNLPAFHCPIFVEYDHRKISHVSVEREAEGNQLNQRRDKHEEQRHWIAQHDQKFLVEDGGESAKGSFHCSIFLVVVLVLAIESVPFRREDRGRAGG